MLRGILFSGHWLPTPPNKQKRIGSLLADFTEPPEGRTGCLPATMLDFSGASTQQPYSAFLWCICPFALSSCSLCKPETLIFSVFCGPQFWGKRAWVEPTLCSVLSKEAGRTAVEAVQFGWRKGAGADSQPLPSQSLHLGFHPHSSSSSGHSPREVMFSCCTKSSICLANSVPMLGLELCSLLCSITDFLHP